MASSAGKFPSANAVISKAQRESLLVKLRASASANMNTSGGTAASSVRKQMSEDHAALLPADHMRPVGVIDTQELSKHGKDAERWFLSIYGAVFDVSAAKLPGRDMPGLPGNEMNDALGHDISWCLTRGINNRVHMNKFFDYFKAEHCFLGNLSVLCQWHELYRNEFGEPVGRLAEYEDAARLPPPPPEGAMECSVM